MDSYEWSGPNGFTSNVETPEIPNAEIGDIGLYSLVVTDNGCVSSSVSVDAQITPNPVVQTLPVNPVCDGNNIQLFANSISSATYNWTGPNGFSSNVQNPLIIGGTLNDAGTYSVIATAGNCPSSAAQVEVTVNPVPQVIASASMVQGCEGSIVSLFATDYEGADYTWFGPNGFISTQQNPILSEVTTLESGTYSVTIVANNCDSPISDVAIEIYPIPTFSLSSNSPICAGNSLNLLSTSFDNASYSWIGPNGFTSNEEDPQIASAGVSDGGMYELVITANGCVSTPQNVNVIVHPIPIANPINSGPVCMGSALQLSTSTANGMSYQWLGPNGFNSTSSAPLINAAQLNNAGEYQLVVTQNGCVSQVGTTSVIVWQNPVVNASVNQDSICFGQSAALTVSGIIQAVWQPGQIQSLNPIVSPNVNTTYTVVGIDANGCSGSDEVEVMVTQPLISANASPESINIPGSVEGYLPLPVVFSINTNCSSFSWDYGDGSPLDNGNDPGEIFAHEYQSENLYFAVVTGNLNGCLVTDTIMVNAYGVAAIGCPEGYTQCALLEIPNIITPNGDSFNDFFWVPNVHLKKLDVQIFNRWGVLVGSINEPNHYWEIPEAFWSGEGYESGVYFYTIHGIGKDGVHFQRQGTFQLVK
jgi:gliding motility-associated-like protein